MSFIRSFAIKLNNRIINNDSLSLIIIKVLPPFKLLFGKEYQKIVKSKTFSKKIKLTKILSIAEHAIKTTPYYAINKNHININNIKDFERIFTPFGKEKLHSNFNELLSTHFQKKNYEIMTTGGTSGVPTRFFVPKSRFKKEYGFFHKIWGILGYKEGLRAVIRNKKLPDNKTYKINPITRELLFDAFRNNDEYFEKIYRSLLKFKVNYIQGYPSSIYSFFQYIHNKKYDITFVKGVFLSSEIFLEHQKILLRDKLKLPIISVYGHSEKLIMAVDFNGDGYYQVIEDYGYLELLDEKGEVIKEEGIQGEIVGTTFSNYGMPLVRYKTGDYSSYIQYSKNKPRILDGIKGRWQEMKIYNRDNSYVTPTALNLHDELYNYIDGLQYFQNEKGKLEVRIIPNISFNSKIETLFLKHFKERMLPNTLITIVKVKKLEKKENGKFLLLESLIEE